MFYPKTTVLSSKAGGCVLTQETAFTKADMFLLRQCEKEDRGGNISFSCDFPHVQLMCGPHSAELVQKFQSGRQRSRLDPFHMKSLPLWVQHQAHQPAVRLGINLLLCRRAVSSAKLHRLAWKTFVERLLLWSS